MSNRNTKLNHPPLSRNGSDFDNLTLLSKENLVFLFSILFIAIITFWKATKNGFTDWDDDLYVVKSTLIRDLSWQSIVLYFKTLTANLYTPLVTLSYAIDYKLYGMSASGFHTTNLLLHGINIFLVYVFTFRLFKRSSVAALTTLFFAIHPLNVEAVVWISSRKDLLFSTFYLLGLIAYLDYLERKQIAKLVLVFVFFILSVLSKPIAFSFPFVLLLIDYYKKQGFTNRQLIEKIPFVIVTVIIGLMGIYLVRRYEVFASAPAGYNLFDKVCLAGFSLTFYLYNAFIPADVSNYHAYPFKDSALLSAKYIFSPILVLIILAVVFILFRKKFSLIFGLLVFLVMIGPTLRLIPTGYPIAADRYFYLASIGLFWFVIFVFEKIYNYGLPLRYVVITIGIVATLAFSIVSYRRVSDWRDTVSLWSSTLRNDPYHQVANDHLGKLYDKAGNKDLALVHFQRIIERDPTKYDIMNSTGNILVEKKQPDLALKYFNMAIATGNADHLPYYNRGMVYSDQNKFALAIKDFDMALKLKSDFAEAFNNRAIAKVKSGDTAGAYKDFENAVRLKPNDQMMQDNFARIKLMTSK
jgi:protein O-mannosyl-transferase